MTVQLEILQNDLTEPSLSLRQGTQPNQEAPAPQAGSFLVSNEGRCPEDERTGLPLPIAPRSDLASLPLELTNIHHHFYPRLSPALTQTLGGKALRVSRMQLVAATQHNDGENCFHSFFSEGPSIPNDPAEQLGLCVLACAGYLPDKVVDTSSGEPIVRPMREWEYRALQKPNMYIEPLPIQVKRYRDRRHPGLTLIDAKTLLVNSRKTQAQLTYRYLRYGFDPIKSFVVDCVINQDLSDVGRSQRRRFLERDEAEAGLTLLAIASYRAAESARVKGEKLPGVYRGIDNEGRFHHLMPPNASTLIKFKLGDTSHRLEILPLFKERMLQQQKLQVA